MYKLNAQGKFAPFPGITIVSSCIVESSNDLWESVHEALSKNAIISSHFALLPWQSFHMTTLNLWTRNNMNEADWNKLVEENLPFFQSLRRRLEDTLLKPIIVIDRVFVKGTIMIFLRLNCEQDKLLREIAREFKIEFAVQHQYHITLGYQNAPMSENSMNEVYCAMEEILHPFLERRMVLEPQKLCFFKDMTCFTPWDAQSNPFHTTVTGTTTEYNNNKNANDTP